MFHLTAFPPMGATAVCRIELLGSGSSVSTIERLIVEQAKKEEGRQAFE